jgi:hypothetical protein
MAALERYYWSDGLRLLEISPISEVEMDEIYKRREVVGIPVMTDGKRLWPKMEYGFILMACDAAFGRGDER